MKQFYVLSYGANSAGFATKTVHSGSVPGQVKPKTITIGIHKFLFDV